MMNRQLMKKNVLAIERRVLCLKAFRSVHKCVGLGAVASRLRRGTVEVVLQTTVGM